jgi:hypothetical protein
MVEKTEKQPAKPSKTSFVLALPQSMSAQDVVAKGKAAGLTLTDKGVYAIRYEARAKKKKANKKTVGTKVAKGRVQQAVNAVGSFEAHFRKLVLDVGVARAKALVVEVEHKLGALIAGR